jgi:hypothetical protein
LNAIDQFIDISSNLLRFHISRILLSLAKLRFFLKNPNINKKKSPQRTQSLWAYILKNARINQKSKQSKNS